MAVFLYTALKQDGSIAAGELNATDRSDAFRKLERGRLQPVSLKPKEGAGAAVSAAAATSAGKADKARAESEKPAKPQKGKSDSVPSAAASEPPSKPPKTSKLAEGLPKGPVKLRRAQVILFTEELSDLLGAGLQLEPALRIMESRDELSSLKDVTILLRQKIRDGSSFANALRESSKSFGDLYCNMAAAGEISGALPKILRRQAEYMTAIAEIQSKVKTAMIYPLFLIVAGVAVSVVFISYLIPQLTTLLKSMGKPLPGPAAFLMQTGDFFKTWWWLLAILIVFGIWAFQHVTNLPQYREKWHKKKMELPFFGPLLRARFYVQMLETLANLVGNGLPLLRALELTRDASVNLHLKTLLSRVCGMVGEGGSLSRSLKKLEFFPPLLTDMVAVGEQTGDLEHALARTAMRYDKELQRTIDRVSALIQPAILFVMAIVVGMMAYMMISIIMESVGSMRR